VKAPMRILFAAHLVPYPPDTGGKTVTWDTLRCLAGLGAVDVCAFVAPWACRGGVDKVAQAASGVLTLPLRRRSPRGLFFLMSAVRKEPYYITRDYSAAMHARVRDTASGSDLLVADSLHMAPYTAELSMPKILQQHNVESHLVEEFLSRSRPPASWLGSLELRHLRTFERDRCNAFDAVVTLSNLDRQRLEALGVRTPITVAPPTVEPVDAVPDGPNRRNVVHLGTQHWPPIADGLRWYLGEVHGRLTPHLGAAQVVLAGPQPPRDVREEAERRGVRVLGYVDNTEPVYRNTAVFMVPLRIGGGVRLKILHALARGLAVVSTTAGCEGLDLVPEQHLLIADDPDEFASAIVRVLRDPDLRRRLGAEGRVYVLEHFSQKRRWATLAALAKQVTAKRPTLQAEPQVAAGRVP
jgi:glycosyltransferase involved in cell wall biosynthesis